MGKTFLIVGGYGNTGLLLSELLLEHIPDCRLIIAGRNKAKAATVTEQLNQTFSGGRVGYAFADAANIESLKQAMGPADMVIMAAGTIQYVNNVTQAALDTNTDYLDTQLSNLEKLSELKSQQSEMLKKKRIFITDAGFHPGVPAAMVRYAAEQMDELSSGIVYSELKLNWKQYNFDESTINEMMDEFKEFKSQIFSNGEWKTIKWKDMPQYDFGEPYGKQLCYPIVMNEFEQLPELIPTIKDAGFYVTGFNTMTDYIIIPVVIAGLKLFPKSVKALGKLFLWGLQNFSKPPYQTQLVLEASGKQNGQPAILKLVLSHSDAYYLTAAPIAACLKQYNAGLIKQYGLSYQANIVQPDMFFNDMKKMKIKTESHINTKD